MVMLQVHLTAAVTRGHEGSIPLQSADQPQRFACRYAAVNGVAGDVQCNAPDVVLHNSTKTWL